MHICMYLFIFIFPKQSSAVGVLTVWYKGPCRVARSGRALGKLCALSFLCAGCGNGEGHVAPVYAKHSFALTLVVKHNGFRKLYLSMSSGALGSSGCLLGASWVPPGCLWAASWVLPGCPLGVCWVSLGCVQMIPAASR